MKQYTNEIQEEICTYEVCKLAREKGFPVKEIEHWYCEYDGRPTKEIIDEQQHPIINQSLLQRWLREEKGIIIELKYSDSTESWRPFWSWCIYNNLGITLEIGDNSATYELTLEDALKYALENLV